MQALLGIPLLICLAWLISESRSKVSWRVVLIGLAIQFLLAFLFLKVSWIAESLLVLNQLVHAIEQATLAGTIFLFGYIGGGDTPFVVGQQSATYLFAFRVLPQVIVFSTIIAVLWYWQVLPTLVRGFGYILRRSLGVSGALGMSGAASLFLGMVETPLVIRAYLSKLSRAELFAVMTFGMSTVAGSVMVLYASVLINVSPGVVGHILSASVINVIGAIYISRIMVPQTEPETEIVADLGFEYSSFMDAVARGTSDGLTLAMNVGAMLLVLISLVALVNGVLGFIALDDLPLSLQRIFGWVFSPVAWLIGIPWAEANIAGSLLGTKVVLNELVAYVQLADLSTTLSEPSRLVLIYALCGFANFGSLGILIGGLSTLIPQRREELLSIAPKSLISGTLVTLITGAIVSLISLL